jgi:hypothetical protein
LGVFVGNPNNDEFVKSPKIVTPVETGVQNPLKPLDSGSRRNDENRTNRTFYENINNISIDLRFYGWA